MVTDSDAVDVRNECGANAVPASICCQRINQPVAVQINAEAEMGGVFGDRVPNHVCIQYADDCLSLLGYLGCVLSAS